ncbi:MAG: hypothetical protein LUQ20_07915 [Candidatus Methanoperedens sp.]|nr:hypothetical protein [Candidatus Methanoperedens sp.]
MDKSMNISDRNFHSRITGRYQKGKRNPYDFPLMIFFKNTGQLLSHKVNLSVLLQFNITRNITTQHILESVEGIKSLLGWFRIERSIPKQNKVSSLAFRSKNIPLFFNYKKYENLPNGVEDISLADNSVSWDYKFVFHNESPVILQHVNLLLINSKLANSLNYPEVLNDITKSSINKYNSYFNNYIQIINHGLHPEFEPAILPHVNLLLNSMSIQGDILTSKEYFNFSKLDKKYHVILPHVNLLLNTISANNMQSQIQDSYFISGQRFDYSFPQADLMVHEFKGDKEIHFTNVQRSNLVYNFPAILQYMDTIQKNMPEMILSHSKSFPTSIKHNQEMDYQRTLSGIMPSIIKSDTTTENHDLHFKTNRKIEEEIENVKRIAYEAKQTVIESVKNIQTSHVGEMNRKININQLSDQVYRLLDRKITIEKERRGYI